MLQPTKCDTVNVTNEMLRTTDPLDTHDILQNRSSGDGPSLCEALSVAPHKLWVDNMDWILTQSQHPDDKEGRLLEEMKGFLYRITPRLPFFLSSLPRDWELVGRIAKKAWKRYQYLQRTSYRNISITTTNEKPPPKVKIVVLGGSVTRGVNCNSRVRSISIENCRWTAWLGSFLNSIAGGELVDLVNHAVGATNTQIGTTLLRYEMLPEDVKQPDIIINAYSTNDMHALTFAEAKGQDVSLRDYIFEMQQDFVRTAMRHEPCQDPPLVIFLDDYLGNEQREIIATTDVGQSLQILATYYGIGTVSYANMVRDIVYKNTRETSFSPAGWYKKSNSQMNREIHPQIGMHYTVAWSMAFYFLQLASTYCTTASVAAHQGGQPLRTGDVFDSGALPPLLTPSSSLADVSRNWDVSIQEERNSSATACLDKEETFANNTEAEWPSHRCTFSWMGMLQFKKSKRPHDWIENYFKPYMTTQNQLSSWHIDRGGGGKLGWSPVDASTLPFTLDFPLNTLSVSTVTALYMRSYGEKWENSTVEVNISALSGGDGENNNTTFSLLHTERIKGFHSKETSELYPLDVQLPSSITPPSTLRIEFRLVGGTTFKIMGLAFCR